jgi:hypothetical protein
MKKERKKKNKQAADEEQKKKDDAIASVIEVQGQSSSEHLLLQLKVN